MLENMAFCCLQENLVIYMEKKIMDTATKQQKLKYMLKKTASKRVVQKNAAATGDFVGNKNSW